MIPTTEFSKNERQLHAPRPVSRHAQTWRSLGEEAKEEENSSPPRSPVHQQQQQTFSPRMQPLVDSSSAAAPPYAHVTSSPASGVLAHVSAFPLASHSRGGFLYPQARVLENGAFEPAAVALTRADEHSYAENRDQPSHAHDTEAQMLPGAAAGATMGRRADWAAPVPAAQQHPSLSSRPSTGLVMPRSPPRHLQQAVTLTPQEQKRLKLREFHLTRLFPGLLRTKKGASGNGNGNGGTGAGTGASAGGEASGNTTATAGVRAVPNAFQRRAAALAAREAKARSRSASPARTQQVAYDDGVSPSEFASTARSNGAFDAFHARFEQAHQAAQQRALAQQEAAHAASLGYSTHRSNSSNGSGGSYTWRPRQPVRAPRPYHPTVNAQRPSTSSDGGNSSGLSRSQLALATVALSAPYPHPRPFRPCNPIEAREQLFSRTRGPFLSQGAGEWTGAEELAQLLHPHSSPHGQSHSQSPRRRAQSGASGGDGRSARRSSSSSSSHSSSRPVPPPPPPPFRTASSHAECRASTAVDYYLLGPDEATKRLSREIARSDAAKAQKDFLRRLGREQAEQRRQQALLDEREGRVTLSQPLPPRPLALDNMYSSV